MRVFSDVNLRPCHLPTPTPYPQQNHKKNTNKTKEKTKIKQQQSFSGTHLFITIFYWDASTKKK